MNNEMHLWNEEKSVTALYKIDPSPIYCLVSGFFKSLDLEGCFEKIDMPLESVKLNKEDYDILVNACINYINKFGDQGPYSGSDVDLIICAIAGMYTIHFDKPYTIIHGN
jgi:hypothetical protein